LGLHVLDGNTMFFHPLHQLFTNVFGTVTPSE
jgi:hypothetical protein